MNIIQGHYARTRTKTIPPLRVPTRRMLAANGRNIKSEELFLWGRENDVISYVSAIANMERGHLVLGVKDKTLEIVGADFRNECLCRALVDFNMIDTVSRGIKKMFNEQWRRHFPMPDYEIDQIQNNNRCRILDLYGYGA